MVTSDEVCNAIDLFEISNNLEDQKCAVHIIRAGWIQNELRIEKHNPDKKISRTKKEIDDLAMKDLFEQDKKLDKIVSEAKELYREHKKFK